MFGYKLLFTHPLEQQRHQQAKQGCQGQHTSPLPPADEEQCGKRQEKVGEEHGSGTEVLHTKHGKGPVCYAGKEPVEPLHKELYHTA